MTEQQLADYKTWLQDKIDGYKQMWKSGYDNDQQMTKGYINAYESALDKLNSYKS